ncbi:MAG TPA: polysaccharide deacetylase family protein [Bryobacteraceae bacterium]|nr:polysaccharide deacetylase family protein [Bryobacteraceae bacterium]
MSVYALAKRALFSTARYSGLNWFFRQVLGREGVLVLCYHGVVPREYSNQLFLYRNTVSEREFGRQLEFLVRHFRPIAARDLIDHIRLGTSLKPRTVLVTFDDGYRNNLTLAAPLLSRYGVPALISVTTGYIGTPKVLWPDEVNLRVLDWPLASIPYPSMDGKFAMVPLASGQDPRIFHAEKIRALCKALPEQALGMYLDTLRREPCPALDSRDRDLFDFLNWDEVRSLVAAGFDIASHTVSHPILTQIGRDRLDDELRESKRRIEAATGKACECLVYPNGQSADFSPQVAEAARQAGYLLGFSLTGSYACTRADAFALSRISVPGHQPEAVFEARASGLHTWMQKIL